MISKEDFIKTLENVRKVNDYGEDLNKLYRKYDLDGYLFQPGCTIDVLRLLHIIFGDADKDEWISYFVFELNFGKNWKPGMVTENKKDIDLSTIEKLYDFLINNQKH